MVLKNIPINTPPYYNVDDIEHSNNTSSSMFNGLIDEFGYTRQRMGINPTPVKTSAITTAVSKLQANGVKYWEDYDSSGNDTLINVTFDGSLNWLENNTNATTKDMNESSSVSGNITASFVQTEYDSREHMFSAAESEIWYNDPDTDGIGVWNKVNENLYPIYIPSGSTKSSGADVDQDWDLGNRYFQNTIGISGVITDSQRFDNITESLKTVVISETTGITAVEWSDYTAFKQIKVQNGGRVDPSAIDFLSGDQYSLGQVVVDTTDSDRCYVKITTGSAVLTTAPVSDTTNWARVDEWGTHLNVPQIFDYKIGDLVYEGTVVYSCTQDNGVSSTTKQPSTNPLYWLPLPEIETAGIGSSPIKGRVYQNANGGEPKVVYMATKSSTRKFKSTSQDFSEFFTKVWEADLQYWEENVEELSLLPPDNVEKIAYSNGHLLARTVGENSIEFSAAFNPFYWQGESFQPDAGAGNITTYEAYRDGVVIFCTDRVEFFYYDGIAPFRRQDGYTINTGCRLRNTVVNTEDFLFFLDIEGMVQQISGVQVKPIGQSIMKELREGGNIGDAIAYRIKERGVELYVLSLPTLGKTFAYHISKGYWCNFTWSDDTGSTYGEFFGRVSDSYDLLSMDTTIIGSRDITPPAGSRGCWFNDVDFRWEQDFDPYATPQTRQYIDWRKTTGHIDYGTLLRKRSKWLRIKLRKETDSSDLDIKFRLRYRDDGDAGVWSDWLEWDISTTDTNYEFDIDLFRLGTYRSRQYEFDLSYGSGDDNKEGIENFRIIQAIEEVEIMER